MIRKAPKGTTMKTLKLGDWREISENCAKERAKHKKREEKGKKEISALLNLFGESAEEKEETFCDSELC